jgi:hypothetical protein
MRLPMPLRHWLVALCCFMAVQLAVAQPTPPLRGRPVQSVFDDLRAAGAPLVYSSNLLPVTLTVVVEPRASAPLALAREILAPHGLAVREEAGVWLVVRGEPLAPPSPGRVVVRADAGYAGTPLATVTVELDPPGGLTAGGVAGQAIIEGVSAGRHSVVVRSPGFLPERVAFEVAPGATAELAVGLLEAVPKLDELIVSASRYDVSSDVRPSATYFSRDEIEALAALGDDTIRVAQRLPGVASTEFSARPYVRGGAANELAVVLDGVRLIEPYHLRDFQGVFSAVDQRIIGSLAVHAGGFPAAFGDALSALMVIEPREPTALAHEIGMSALYTSALSSGVFADGGGSWLASARSSNLDRVLSDRLGQPAYSDLFLRVSSALGDRHRVVLGSLAFRDDVLLTLKDEPADRQSGGTDTDSRQLWLRLDSDWSDAWSSSMSFFTTNLESSRRESVADLDELVGSIDDRRELDAAGLRHLWRYEPSTRQSLSFGIEAERRDTVYRYASVADRRGLLATLGGTAPPERMVEIAPEGERYAVFVEDRVRFTDRLIADLGLRWDRQSYLPPGQDSQFSPRAGLLYRAGPKTDVRVSYGRFFQPEGPLELQVEDGVAAFARAQSSGHTIVSLERRLGGTLALRAELYRKWTRHVRARYENLFDPLLLAAELRASRIHIAPERAEARGVELFVSGETPVAWWAGVSFAHADDRIDGRWVPRSWDQHQALNAGVTWPVGAWTLSAAAAAHRGWPATELEVVTTSAGEQIVVAGERNAIRLGNVRRLDARVSRDFDAGVGALRFFIEVTNLTNRDNPCCLVYEPVTSLSGAASLAVRERSRVGSTGNVGVLWQF